ncbi:MAG: AAA family ATPase [Promethearchaeota archaeon]
MSFYYVYILETINAEGKKKYYTGYTKDLQRRLAEHKKGAGAKFCRGKKIDLKYFETFTTQGDAIRRELEIKSFSRNKKMELIKILENSRFSVEDSNFIIILVGLPASGKSTFSHSLEKVIKKKFIGFDFIVIDPDILRNEIMKKKFDPSKEHLVRKKNLHLIKNALKEKKIVISDDLNYYASMRHDIKKIAEELGVLYFIIHINTPLKKCLEWNKVRGKPIPDSIIIDIASKIEFYSKYNWDRPIETIDLSIVKNLENESTRIIDLIIKKLNEKKIIKDEPFSLDSEILRYNERLDRITRSIIKDLIITVEYSNLKEQIIDLRKKFIKENKNTKISDKEISKLFLKDLRKLRNS